MFGALLEERLQPTDPQANRLLTPRITPGVCKDKTGVRPSLADALLVDRKEMTDVVGNERPAQLRRLLQHQGVVGAEELGMVGLNRLDIPSPPPKLDRDGWVQHLVEEEFQPSRAFCCRSESLWMRSVSSRLSVISSSISDP